MLATHYLLNIQWTPNSCSLYLNLINVATSKLVSLLSGYGSPQDTATGAERAKGGYHRIMKRRHERT